MTGRGPVTGRRSRLSPRRLPPGVLTLLCLAPTLDALVAITGNRALAILAVNTARVAIPAAGLTLCARDQPGR